MPDFVVKYLVRLKFSVSGVVEKADVVGAIFGQTEGLFGPEMNLNELQKTWKIGRIEISLTSKNDDTSGEVLIPMSTDISTAALISAAVESVDKVGPCTASFSLVGIEDARAIKRKSITDRAKNIMKDWASKTTSESDKLLEEVSESTKRGKVLSYGKDQLPSTSGIADAEAIVLVEGRADVINLLRASIENVIALEGTKVPKTIIDLCKGKRVTAFLDGDHSGDLIAKELAQVVNVDRMIRAPAGKEVEDLTPVEIQDLIKGDKPQKKPPIKTQETKPRPPETKSKVNLPDEILKKVKEVQPSIEGTLEAAIFDKDLKECCRCAVSELVKKLETCKDPRTIVFDGIITQRLAEASSKCGITTVVGHRMGAISKKPSDVALILFGDL